MPVLTTFASLTPLKKFANSIILLCILQSHAHKKGALYYGKEQQSHQGQEGRKRRVLYANYTVENADGYLILLYG